MALRNSLFAVSGKASFLDARRDMSGLFVCDKNTMMPIAGILDRSQDNLVTGSGDSMSVTVHPFNAVLNRYGALLIQNDGNVRVPLDAAPSANSRIDVVYVKQNETRPPMSDGSDVPKFFVAKGVAAATPVAPSVPAGGLALAQVLLPAGVSNTAAAGVVITQTYIGAAMKGDMLRVQNSAQRDALTGVPDGTLLHNVADNCDYVRNGGSWKMKRKTITFGSVGRNTVVGAVENVNNISQVYGVALLGSGSTIPLPFIHPDYPNRGASFSISTSGQVYILYGSENTLQRGRITICWEY